MKTADGRTAFHQMTLTESNESKKDNFFARFFKAEFRGGHWAENHLIKTIPKIPRTANWTEYKELFTNLLAKTKTYGESFKHGFELQEQKVKSKKDDGMEVITKRGNGIVEETEYVTTADSSMDYVGQNVEHFEISTYGGLAQIERILGEYDVVEFIEVPQEEKNEAIRF